MGDPLASNRSQLKSCDSKKLSNMLNLNMQSIVEDESDKELSESYRRKLYPPEHQASKVKSKKSTKYSHPDSDHSSDVPRSRKSGSYSRFESREERQERLKL